MMRMLRPILFVALSAVSAAASAQIVFPNGSVQSIAGVEYTRIVVVNADGNNAQNGAALLDALADIASPSSSNRFALYLEPGIYDLAATPLAMRGFVDIIGSGLTNTTITSTAATTVTAANNAFLREVRLQNTGAGTTVFLANNVATELYRVSCVHLGTSGANTAVSAQGGADLTLVNVLASAAAASSGTNTAMVASGAGTTLGLRSSSIAAANGATNVGLNAGANTTAVLGFVQIDITGSGTGIVAGSGSVCSLFSCAVIAFSGTSLNNAGSIAAGASAIEGTVTGAGTTIFTQCFNGSFQPIADSLPAGTP